jgi:hypothetical protein
MNKTLRTDSKPQDKTFSNIQILKFCTANAPSMVNERHQFLKLLFYKCIIPHHNPTAKNNMQENCEKSCSNRKEKEMTVRKSAQLSSAESTTVSNPIKLTNYPQPYSNLQTILDAPQARNPHHSQAAVHRNHPEVSQQKTAGTACLSRSQT